MAVLAYLILICLIGGVIYGLAIVVSAFVAVLGAFFLLGFLIYCIIEWFRGK